MCFQLTSPQNAIPLERIAFQFESSTQTIDCGAQDWLETVWPLEIPSVCICSYKNQTLESERAQKKERTAPNIHAKNFQTRFPFFQLGKIEIAIIWFICCIKFNCQLYVTVKQNVIPNSRYNNLLLSPDLFWLHTNWVGRTHAVFSSFLISFFMKKIVYLFVCLWVWFNANGRRPNWSEEYLQMP